jgi:RNA recognition motif-containing protein
VDRRLYVSNLGSDISLASLRRCFSACGDVVAIEFAAERSASRASSAAFITMATAQAADVAVRRLNGSILEGRSLMVSTVPGSSNASAPEGRPGKAPKVPAGIGIKQQYRERHNMTYELDAGGPRLTLRIYFPPDTGPVEWRIEARSSGGDSGIVVDRSAPTKALALQAVAEAWQALAADPLEPSLDWPAITRALRDVRAI